MEIYPHKYVDFGPIRFDSLIGVASTILLANLIEPHQIFKPHTFAEIIQCLFELTTEFGVAITDSIRFFFDAARQSDSVWFEWNKTLFGVTNSIRSCIVKRLKQVYSFTHAVLVLFSIVNMLGLLLNESISLDLVSQPIKLHEVRWKSFVLTNIWMFWKNITMLLKPEV